MSNAVMRDLLARRKQLMRADAVLDSSLERTRQRREAKDFAALTRPAMQALARQIERWRDTDLTLEEYAIGVGAAPGILRRAWVSFGRPRRRSPLASATTGYRGNDR